MVNGTTNNQFLDHPDFDVVLARAESFGIFTVAAFQAAVSTMGLDRIMFSVNYPYADNHQAMKFLRSLPIPPADLAKVAAGTASSLLRLNTEAKVLAPELRGTGR